MALAKAGARVIAVDEAAGNLGDTRERADREGVKVETHQGPLAELAFVRADTIDAAVSAYGLATVEDRDRVFRQVHRVLRTDRPFVFSLPHPAFVMLDPSATEPVLRRTWWDPAPAPWSVADDRGEPDRVTSLTGLFAALGARQGSRSTRCWSRRPTRPRPATRGPTPCAGSRRRSSSGPASWACSRHSVRPRAPRWCIAAPEPQPGGDRP